MFNTQDHILTVSVGLKVTPYGIEVKVLQHWLTLTKGNEVCNLVIRLHEGIQYVSRAELNDAINTLRKV